MKKSSSIRRRRITPYLYIAPFFIGYLVFSLYPTLYALGLSFYDWAGMGDKIFVGLDNYIEAFQNEYFWHSMWVSFLYILTGPITTFFALLLAFLLNSKMVRGTSIYRITYFFPTSLCLWQWDFCSKCCLAGITEY